MTSLIEALGDRAIGAVEEVSANAISVLLDPDAPQATALNAGSPAGFPRINGYLLVPNEGGATVGLVTRVQIVRLPYPKRRGMQDFGLVDLPFPARVLSLTPLGTLLARAGGSGRDLSFRVRRGVDVFPSVGDPVVLPTEAQLRAIVEGEDDGQARRILLGTCPTAASAPVHVDPDKLFGRHLAVLGNTGAGKSCSVAGLIRWSLDAARRARTEAERGDKPNARFIVLDPNGEYAKAFAGLNARLFQVSPQGDGKALKVPAWLWNGEEWAAFTGAAPGVQRPILFDAIRRLRSGAGTPDTFQSRARGRIRRYRTGLRLKVQGGDHLQAGRREGVAQLLLNCTQDFEDLAGDAECSDEGLRDQFRSVAKKCREVEEAARGKTRDGGHWHNDFAETNLETVQAALGEVASAVGLSEDESGLSEDAPRFFPARELPGFVDALAADATGRDLAQFVDSLNLRIRGLFAGGPLASVLDPGDSPSVTLDEWLTDHVGADEAANGALAIVDLSLVPSEVIHIVVSVLARMVFEAVQRYRRTHASVLPTVLVLEEAHTFVHRDLTADGAPPAGRVCCRTFERIAREGRKFGLGLVLASQRPSEMSATVLSQCNTFLLHRIVNDRDQDLVRRLVPDALGDLLRELPSLPSRRAILLGWAAPAPVLMEIREVPEAQRPHSPDPDFWDVWTGKSPRGIDWKVIADAWTGTKELGGLAEQGAELW
ncbi:MAG: ATP-binding protein [Planctomycetes bacterium]|nr:ATP-binding protein [Planctomycetota bacterium]